MELYKLSVWNSEYDPNESWPIVTISISQIEIILNFEMSVFF